MPAGRECAVRCRRIGWKEPSCHAQECLPGPVVEMDLNNKRSLTQAELLSSPSVRREAPILALIF